MTYNVFDLMLNLAQSISSLVKGAIELKTVCRMVSGHGRLLFSSNMT